MDIADRFKVDAPVIQAGMGGVAGAPLAAAVSAAGGLGTLGLAPPDRLSSAITAVREQAPGRAVAVNLVGTVSQADFLPKALALAGSRPVFAAGAAGAVAGTRFLLTHESGAHPVYRQRIIEADRTFETTAFGLAWPQRHRVLPNAATRRWCHSDGRAHWLLSAINRYSAPLSRIPDRGDGALLRLQRPALPFLTPITLTAEMPAEWADRAALYAGETALRLDQVTSAARAVADLTP